MTKAREARKSRDPRLEEKGMDYPQWRSLSLSVTPTLLKLDISGSGLLVFGMVMDWNLDGTLMTLSAYINGAANLYLSSGEVYNSGGLHPAVSAASIALVASSQDKIARCVETENEQLPHPGFVRFCLLTNKGKFVAQEEFLQLESGISPWLPVFKEGCDLITNIKAHAGT